MIYKFIESDPQNGHNGRLDQVSDPLTGFYRVFVSVLAIFY